jgi:RNA polymerase sigma-70 factor, ECF subfamily
METPTPVIDDDATLVRRALTRDEAAVRLLTTRYNQRLFRIARGILRDDADAEDAVQEAYVRAFTGLEKFRGESSFGTWLVRIVMNEALGRLRRRRPTVTLDDDSGRDPRGRAAVRRALADTGPPDPERVMAVREMKILLEHSIDRLPEAFRLVFVARMVEGMSVDETAQAFDLRPETVKTRVHRARRRLRADLDRHLGSTLGDAFTFDGARCDRLTAAVIARLHA